MVGGIVACAAEHAGAAADPDRHWRSTASARRLPAALRPDHPSAARRSGTGNAAELAARLAAHPQLTDVRYPGLSGVDSRQMRGPGAMLAFQPAGGPYAVVGKLQLVTLAVSLGSVDTLIEHPGP